MGEGKPQEKEKSKGTFLIKINYSENATWQGEVTWVEAKRKQGFRSALELIKLIDSAVEKTEEI